MKICNLDYIKNITPGSNTFAIQLIKLFLDDTPKSLQAITTCLENENWEELYRNTHKIKPSLEMLGLQQEIIDALLQIDHYAHTKTHTEKIPDLIAFFMAKTDLIFEELTVELNQLENSLTS